MNYFYLAIACVALLLTVHAINLTLKTFWMILRFFVDLTARLERTA